MIKLYDFPKSGHCHKVRALLATQNIDHELVQVDLLAGEHLGDAFKELNPFSKVPVLTDENNVIADSNAILIYLAEKYDLENVYPKDAKTRGEIQSWLSKSANEVLHGPAYARMVTVFGASFDHQQAIETAHAFLTQMNDHLADRDWLVSDHVTLADYACYSYVAHAPEGNVSLDDYDHVNAWLRRFETLPGFVAMPKTDVD